LDVLRQELEAQAAGRKLLNNDSVRQIDHIQNRLAARRRACLRDIGGGFPRIDREGTNSQTGATVSGCRNAIRIETYSAARNPRHLEDGRHAATYVNVPVIDNAVVWAELERR
jgi:hypothetical protein